MADMDPNELSRLLGELNDTIGALNYNLDGFNNTIKKSTNTQNTFDNSVQRSILSSQQSSTNTEKTTSKFTTNLNNVSNGLMSLTKTITSTQAGFAKYGSVISALGDKTSEILSGMGLAGKTAAVAVKGLSMFAEEALKMNDNMINMSRESTKFAGIIPVTTRTLADMSAKAGYAGEKMSELTKITGSIEANLVALGGTAGQGVKRFTELANVGNDVYESFAKMNVSQESLTEMQSYYVRMQGISGKAYKLQTDDMGKLRSESLAYAENLVKMSSITGQTAEQQQRELEQVRMAQEEMILRRREELDIQTLTNSDRKEEAEKLRASSDARAKIMDLYTQRYGEETGNLIGRVLRTGTFDELSAGLANLGISVQDLQKIQSQAADEALAAGNDQQKRSDALTKNAFAATEMYSRGVDRFSKNLGTAAQYSQEIFKEFGITQEALLRDNRFIGKSAMEIYEMLQKEAADSKAQNDSARDSNAERESSERTLNLEYQKAMLNLSGVIIPQLTKALETLTGFISNTSKTFDDIGKAMGGLKGVAIAGAAALAGLWGAMQVLKGFIFRMILNSEMGGGGGPGLGGGPAGRGGGKFNWGKLLKGGKIIGGGLAGLLLGSGLDMGANYATEHGHEKIGAGLGIASGAVTGASTGAMLGSFFGPLGTVIGGVGGGLLGAGVAAWNRRSAFEDPEKQAKKQMELVNENINVTDKNNDLLVDISTDDKERFEKNKSLTQELIDALKNLKDTLEKFLPSNNAATSGSISNAGPVLDAIARAEGTYNTGYNTSLGYGKYLPGGKEQNLTDMTLAQIHDLGLYMRKQKGNPNSSALGRYQIVGDTLKDAAKGLGLDMNTTKFDAATQDRLAMWIVENQGFVAWQGFNRNQDQLAIAQKALANKGNLQAANGGIFSGPNTGYPITMHGTEIVAPVSPNSVLMKLAKEQASSSDTLIGNMSNQNVNLEVVVASQSKMIDVLASKLDTVIYTLENGNYIQDKILRQGMA